MKWNEMKYKIKCKFDVQRGMNAKKLLIIIMSIKLAKERIKMKPKKGKTKWNEIKMSAEKSWSRVKMAFEF